MAVGAGGCGDLTCRWLQRRVVGGTWSGQALRGRGSRAEAGRAPVARSASEPARPSARVVRECQEPEGVFHVVAAFA